VLETPSQIPDSFKQAVQGGYEKDGFRPDRFCKLPREMVDDMGPILCGGGIRWTALAVSHMAARAQEQAGAYREAEFETAEFECDVGESEFVYTQASCAEDFMARYGAAPDDVYDDGGEFTDRARRQYQQIHRSFDRIRGNWAEERRECCPGTKVLGTIWRMVPLTVDQIKALPTCQELQYRPSDLEDGELLDFCTDAEGMVDVACLYEMLARRRHPERFRQAETCSSVRNRGTYSDAIKWAQAFARDGSRPHAGDRGERHMSVGAYRDSDLGKMGPDAETPCTVPWVVLEAEAGDITDRHEATRRILEALDAEGADLSEVVVSYSGNKSFHVRIPTGMVGRPVFEGAETAETVVRRFAQDVVDEELDANLFDPRHLIRCIGSVHEETGRHVSAVHADTFLQLSLDEMLSMSQRHTPFALRDPFRVERTALAERMQEASSTLTDFWIPEYEECPTMSDSSGGVVQRAMQGVEEGSQWHEKHQGRNKATFIAACYLIEQHGEQRAWQKTQAVNDRHSPSLPRKEVKTCFESAKRTVQ